MAEPRQNLTLEWKNEQQTLEAKFFAETREEANGCVLDLVQYLGATLDNGNSFTLRIDTVESAPCGSQGIKDIVKFMRRYRPKCAAQMRGTALVIQSKVMRWVINTLFYIQAPASPVTVVSNVEQADQYIHKALRVNSAESLGSSQVQVDHGMVEQMQKASDAQDLCALLATSPVEACE